MMLLPVLIISALCFDNETDGSVRGAGPPVVERFSLREEHYLPPALVESLAPIDVLGVDEKTLVEQTDFLHRSLSDCPETPVDDFYRARVTVVPIGKEVAPKQLGAR